MPYVPQVVRLLSDVRRPGIATRRRDLISRYGRRAFDEARTTGQITEILPAIYGFSGHSQSMPTRLRAASLWVEGRGSLSGVASCIIHGLQPPRETAITVISRGTKFRNPPNWLRLRRLENDIPFLIHTDHHVAELPDALAQAWWDEGPVVARELLMQAVRRRRNVTKQVRYATKRYPMLPRRTEFLELLLLLGEGIESFLEDLAHRTVLNVPDLLCFKKQVPMTIQGQRLRLDAYDEATRVALEFDGASFHSSREAQLRDRERDALLMSVGIMPLRFTYRKIVDDPEWCREIIRSAMRQQRTHFSRRLGT